RKGASVRAGEVEGDVWVEIYFLGLDGLNAFYGNLGNLRFEEVTEMAGVACPELDATGAAFADLDGDGELDLIVNSVGGGTHIFLNDGKGRFTESPRRLNPGRGGMSLALGDVDGDGYLDLYIANYRASALMDIPNAHATFKRVNGKVMIDRLDRRPTSEPDLTNRFIVSAQHGIEALGEPDILYRKEGVTTFVPDPFTAGAYPDADGEPLTERTSHG